MVAPATTRNQARSQPVRAIRRPLDCARGDVGGGNARGYQGWRKNGNVSQALERILQVFPKPWKFWDDFSQALESGGICHT